MPQGFQKMYDLVGLLLQSRSPFQPAKVARSYSFLVGHVLFVVVSWVQALIAGLHIASTAQFLQLEIQFSCNCSGSVKTASRTIA